MRLIEDADGEYIYPQNATNSSKPISLEEALVLAMRADFWLNLGQVASLTELKAVAPRFADVDAQADAGVIIPLFDGIDSLTGHPHQIGQFLLGQVFGGTGGFQSKVLHLNHAPQGRRGFHADTHTDA